MRKRKLHPQSGDPESPLVEWMLTDWFCPACGKKGMWQRGLGQDDYYHTSSVTCHSCGHQMCCVDLTTDTE